MFPYKVVRERLGSSNTELTNFYLRYGANVYVFTYENNGRKRHTFIDTGFASQKDLIFPILEENGIDLDGAERIILTHRHSDHCGLAGTISGRSDGKITVHCNFKSFVEGIISPEERVWMGDFDPTELKDRNMEYLEPTLDNPMNINGLKFPRLGDPIEIGDAGTLEIITCPENDPTHSPDQLLVLFSPGASFFNGEDPDEKYRPTDRFIFSGDLWLMRGPVSDRNLTSAMRRMRLQVQRLKGRLAGADIPKRDPRIQDAEAKEALKVHFSLIRVKPGHGDEFLGSNMVPKALLADRDLLVKLGFAMDDDKAILKSDRLASQLTEIKAKAYASFVQELKDWTDLGYGPDEIVGLLVRIYREQHGGGPLVEQDRKERRQRIKRTLTRLSRDKAESDDLHQIAASTLAEVEKII